MHHLKYSACLLLQCTFESLYHLYLIAKDYIYLFFFFFKDNNGLEEQEKEKRRLVIEKFQKAPFEEIAAQCETKVSF